MTIIIYTFTVQHIYMSEYSGDHIYSWLCIATLHSI